MQFTITQQGHRWIASDGTRHVEDDSPVVALASLQVEMENNLSPLTDEEVDAAAKQESLADLVESITRLICLASMYSSANFIRREVKLIAKKAEHFIETWEL